MYILSVQFSRHFNCEKNKNCLGLIIIIIIAAKKKEKKGKKNISVAVQRGNSASVLGSARNIDPPNLLDSLDAL